VIVQFSNTGSLLAVNLARGLHPLTRGYTPAFKSNTTDTGSIDH